MSFESMIEALHALRDDLCAVMRRGEMLWLGMASDYQSKYAFSADYDPAFKRGYYDRATACRETAEWLETLDLPSAPEEVALFVNALGDAIEGCPRHPDVGGQLESLAGRVAGAAATAAGGSDT